jgi:glycosyltransferase involved in cell wall biosynthesis
VVEAAVFGVPAVAVDEGGPRYTVIDGETGMRVASDPAAIAAAITRLLADRAEARRMGERARAHVVGRYTWEQGARDFLSACGALVEHA